MLFKKKRRYSKYSSYSTYSSYSRRKRVRWDRILPVAGVCLVVLLVVVGLNFNRIKLMVKGYSFSTTNQILKLEKEDVKAILSYDKLDHMTDWLEKGTQTQFYDEYEAYITIHKDLEVDDVIATVDDFFTNYIPKFDALGYTNEQVWSLLKTANAKDLQYIIDKKYSYAQMQPFMEVNGFKFTDMEGYMKVYATKQNYNYAVLMTSYPFIDANNKPTIKYTIQNPENILNLVKVGFELPSSYEPTDLVTPNLPIAPDCQNYTLRKEAAEALEKMYKAAKDEGYHLVLNSGYRSYDKQVQTYKDFENRYGGIYAKEHVALPGSSEHQTGLGVDLTSQSVVNGDRLVFGDTSEYQWVLKNAHKYGFILRFPEGKIGFTGIVHEPWHFRYVGEEAATTIYNNNWTLEDYCLYNGIIPLIKEQ